MNDLLVYDHWPILGNKKYEENNFSNMIFYDSDYPCSSEINVIMMAKCPTLILPGRN